MLTKKLLTEARRLSLAQNPKAVGFGEGAYTADDLFRFARALRTGMLVPMALDDSITRGEVSMGGPAKYALGHFDRPMQDRRVVDHSGSNPDTGTTANSAG